MSRSRRSPGNREAMAKFTQQALEKIIVATLDRHDDGRLRRRSEEVARDRQGSALEALLYRTHLPAHARSGGVTSAPTAISTFIVTGFGQDFVRVYAQQIYDIPTGAGNWLGAGRQICLR